MPRGAAVLGCFLLFSPFALTGCDSSGGGQTALAPTPPARSMPTPAPQTDVHTEANRAWQTADRIHTEEAFQAFAREYSKDPRTAKAKTYAGQLAWLHDQRAGTEDGFQSYLDRYPDGPHAAEARKIVQGEDISLTQALNRGWVASHVTGDDLQSVSFTVERKIHRPLRVLIPAGTYFVSGGDSQNMVATGDNSADLTDSTTCDLNIGAACANFSLEQPNETDRFSIRQAHPNPELRKLLAVIAKQNPNSIVSQLAIWSITDDPSRDEVAGHIFPSPEIDDYQQAAGLLRQAGIRTSSRRMFQ